MWLLLLLPTAAVSGWLMARRERRTAHATRRRAPPPAYFKGLSFLLNEQPDKALQVFLEAVEVDRETVEMHLALGSLFRRRGEIERATRIHQNLLARTNLEESLRTLALFELAQDYFKAGLFDRAENLFRELYRNEEHREPAARFLLQIYEQEKEWHRAITIAKRLGASGLADLSGTLSQYHCELAEQAITEGKNQRAEEHIAAAFRHHPRCVRAVIQSGRLAAMRGNHAIAIAIWRGLEHWAPHALGEVVDHVANSYAALGDLENYLRFLQGALRHGPDWRIMAARVELARHREDEGAARQLLLTLVRDHPCLEGVYALIKSRSTELQTARERKDFRVLAELLAQVVGREREYRCMTCSFGSRSLHWQCPGCKGWGTVQRHLTEDTVGALQPDTVSP